MIVTWILPQTVIPGTAATMVIVCAMGIAVSSSSDLRRSYLLRVIHVVCVGLVAEARVCCMHAEHNYCARGEMHEIANNKFLCLGHEVKVINN